MLKDYETGYGKPPKHGQFKKGRSGNPAGRPKGTKNLKTDLTEELQELILLREGAQSKQVSKQRGMVKALMSKALKGDPRAIDLILKSIFRLIEVDVPEEEEQLSINEQAILDEYEAAIFRKAQEKPSKTPKRKSRKRAPTFRAAPKKKTQRR